MLRYTNSTYPNRLKILPDFTLKFLQVFKLLIFHLLQQDSRLQNRCDANRIYFLQTPHFSP